MATSFKGTEDFQRALNDVIYSSRAISDVTHLKGRAAEVDILTKALLTPGRQPFIYGLRGAGKTSLAVSVSRNFSKASDVQVTCAPQMRFGDVVRALAARALDHNPLEVERKLESKEDGGLNFGVVKVAGSAIETKSFRGIPTPQDPNEAFSILNRVFATKGNDRFCYIVDEFDQLTDADSHLQLGLLAKLIADSNSPIKFIFCGVADDVQQIFKAHPSTLRLFEPIEVNRLKLQACFDIMLDVEQRLGVSIERETKFRIARISDGFPYFIHLILEKILWRWFGDGIGRKAETTPAHYENGLIDASSAAAPELREPYEKAASKYALDGELLIWALAAGGLTEKQIKIIAKDFFEIYNELSQNDKPATCLNQNQISARLALFMNDSYGTMVVRPRRSYYGFAEKRMRGYARLRAALRGVGLRPDHPFAGNNS
jgi:uncharacterized protein